ncbi:MAG: hypothetical protein E7504_02960 [Ruminococcus sp.]|nr:hypothetical protein [Ruminococcus sp.]
MMKHNSDPVSGQSEGQTQEQNYDYIFEELERQNACSSGGIMITDTEGNTKKATVPLALKVFAPALIFIAVIVLIFIASAFSDMLAVALGGFLFMGVTGWKSFTDDKKFRPHPILLIVFIVGVGMAYSAIATMIHRANPIFDIERFQMNSTLGFGIAVLLCGIVMLADSIWKLATCKTEITACCSKIQRMGFQNGKPFGNVTWVYDYEGVSYTERTYNIILNMLEEGAKGKIYIDANHPKRLRRKGIPPLTGWSILFIIAGALMIAAYVFFA